MTRDEEPQTDADLVRRLRVLYEASDHSGGARDDFWDCVSHHIGWIVDLAERGARKKARDPSGQSRGGFTAAAALSPTERTERARLAANARWHNETSDTIARHAAKT